MACCRLRIGVFFDGTGNSKENKDEYSNIAYLHEAYRTIKEEEVGKKLTTSHKIYVDGVGTREDEGVGEKASGGGGAKRIYETIESVCKILDKYPITKNPKKKINYAKREIDIFGFSRGAALARDFVNTFFEDIGSKKNYQDVRFNFIGIYDTVGSFGKAGNDVDMKPKEEYVNEVSESDRWLLLDDHDDEKEFEAYNFHLSAQSAKKIVHIKAAHELRHNFPLFSAKGAGQEISCIGVHSDVGGGYGSRDTETLKMSVLLSDFDKRTALERKGWRYHARRTDRIYGTYEKKREVSNDLQSVSLHLMYEMAIKSGVLLEKPQREIPSDLLEYYEYALQNITKIEHYDGANKLLEEYAHQSATHPLTTTLTFPLRAREDFGELAGVNSVNIKNRQIAREIYSNITKKAIVAS